MADKEKLRAHLQSLAAQLGKTPTVVDMHNNGDYHPEMYTDQYGSWEKALTAAGLDPAEMGAKKIPDRELLAELHRLYEKLGRSPTQQDMNEYGQYADTTYRNRFESWNNALQEAMLGPTQKLTERELLRELERVTGQLGRVPTANEMRQLGNHRPVTYHRRFGSWREAVAQANFGPLDDLPELNPIETRKEDEQEA